MTKTNNRKNPEFQKANCDRYFRVVYAIEPITNKIHRDRNSPNKTVIARLKLIDLLGNKSYCWTGFGASMYL